MLKFLIRVVFNLNSCLKGSKYLEKLNKFENYSIPFLNNLYT